MPVNTTNNYDKQVKILLSPNDRYSTAVVSWDVSCETMDVIPLKAGDEVKTHYDLCSGFFVGGKDNGFSLGTYASTQEEATKEMKEVETLISQLVDYANAVAEAAKNLPEKKGE